MEFFVQILINSLIAAATYTLVGFGFLLMYRTTKFFNLAYDAIIAIGGYAFLLFAQRLELGMTWGIVLGVLVTGAFSFFSELFVFRPLRRRGSSGAVLLIASLGLGIFSIGLISFLFTSQFQALHDNTVPFEAFTIFGGVLTSVQLALIVVAAVVSLVLLLALRFTLFGKAVRAIADDSEVAAVVGIPVDTIISGVFFVSGMIAGSVGILQGLALGVEPTMGLLFLFGGIIAALVGGVDSFVGVPLGALLLALAENFGILFIGGEWKAAIAFVVLLLFLVLRPRGILSS